MVSTDRAVPARHLYGRVIESHAGRRLCGHHPAADQEIPKWPSIRGVPSGVWARWAGLANVCCLSGWYKRSQEKTGKVIINQGSILLVGDTKILCRREDVWYDLQGPCKPHRVREVPSSSSVWRQSGQQSACGCLYIHIGILWLLSTAMLQGTLMQAGFGRPGPTWTDGGSWIPEKAAKIGRIFRHQYSKQVLSDNRMCGISPMKSILISYPPSPVACCVLVAKVL